MNRWKIPDALEEKIRKRDEKCVYCRIRMKDYPHALGARRGKATWEHIDNNPLHASEFNVVRCCSPCNSSKGAKPLRKWFDSSYCKERKISPNTVMPVVKSWLRRNAATNRSNQGR